MNLTYIMSIYISIFFIILILAYKSGRPPLSSFAISLVCSMVFLYIAYPPCLIDEHKENIPCMILYTFVVIFSLVFCMAFTFYYSWKIA